MTLTKKHTTHVLRRLIENPELAVAVQELSAESLAKVVDKVGLEDAGEIISLATTDQLLGVLDSDLWGRERAGDEEKFTSDRFTLWLEILFEAGEKCLVSRLVDLPEELVYLAFHNHILVLNLDDLWVEETSWSNEMIDRTDKALSNCLGHELDEYFVIAKKHEGWDTLLASIVALDEHEPDFLRRILSRCCYVSSEYIEENGGLYEVLTAEQMLESDAAADRADRRAKKGFVAPSDAVAFLKYAAAAKPEEVLAKKGLDPITQAYFRELDRQPDSAVAFRSTQSADSEEKRHTREKPHVLELLEIGNEDAKPPLLAEKDSGSSKKLPALLARLFETNQEVHENYTQQLAYLANMVEARFGSTREPIRPADALKKVIDICEVGLVFLSKRNREANHPFSEEMIFRETSPVDLFILGFGRLSEETSMETLVALDSALEKVHYNN